MTCCLYRHFDRNDRLLYVGISLVALQRISQHRLNSHWFDSITTIRVEHFRSRGEALEAERLAIVNEKPLHNIAHNDPAQVIRASADYRPLKGEGAEKLKFSALPQLVKLRGKHSDGKGLYLCVKHVGHASWIFRYKIGSKRREMGLGPYPLFGLKEAREAAALARIQKANGIDPMPGARQGWVQRVSARQKFTTN